MKMTLVIGAITIGALILFLTSCKNKTPDNPTSENNPSMVDTLTTEVPQQFIDLLFGSQIQRGRFSILQSLRSKSRMASGKKSI